MSGGLLGILRAPAKQTPPSPEVPDPFYTDIDGRYERAEGTEQYPARRVIRRYACGESEVWYSGNHAIIKVGNRGSEFRGHSAFNIHVGLDMGDKYDQECTFRIGDMGVSADIHVHWDALIELARVIAEVAAQRKPQ